MTIYVPGKVTLRQTWQPMDPDAAAYITAVETADGQALEEKVKIAIDNFVLGCKADGIWSAIKASCILAGARTLDGALVPLVGAAPTNYNFVAGDYNRETGLVGNGSTKYLDSNRNNNADPQDNFHLAVYRGASLTTTQAVILAGAGASGTSGRTALNNNHNSQFTDGYFFRARSASDGGTNASENTGATGFIGVSRSLSSQITYRAPGPQSGVIVVASETPHAGNIFIFGTNNAGTVNNVTASRLIFYSIGESLDLASLDARVTDLINAIGVAIP
jgi:hypothetical protein